ncbi:MAG TPA: hypothetical protein PLR18_02420 [bacterium]|nr:hypothetical protein [bacterium]
MTSVDFKKLIQEIVKLACELKDKYTSEKDAPVNYAAIFSQNDKEYDGFYKLAEQIGQIIQHTPTGDLFAIEGLDTVAGELHLLKVRQPEPNKPERGYADFTVSGYATFKKTYLPKTGFRLIQRQDHEMIELIDPAFNARTYFSNPPLGQLLGLR